MGIAAVTFDVWETLIYDDPEVSRQRTERRILDLLSVLHNTGRRFPLAEGMAADIRAMEACEQVWQTLTEVSTRSQVHLFLQCLDHGLLSHLDEATWQELDRVYVDCIFTHPPALSPHAHATLATLKGRGHRLGIVCNTGRTPGAALRRLFAGWGIVEFFDHMLFSNEEGVRKPDPVIFRRELGHLGAPPDQAVHVGDNPVADIGGARGVGMYAIQIGDAQPKEPVPPPHARIGHLGEVVGMVERLARERPAGPEAP